MKSFAVAALLTAAALLAACSTLTEHAPAGNADERAWATRNARLSTLVDWRLSGRVGFINGKDSGSGSLDWQQQGDSLALDFHGPLGTGGVHIDGEGGVLRVRSSRGDDFVTDDPESDLGARLHQPLPVLSLRYWVRGIPDPASDFTKRSDASGELVSLDQRGWHVDYQEYAVVAGYSLPTRLTLARGTVRIKLAISDWTLPGGEP